MRMNEAWCWLISDQRMNTSFLEILLKYLLALDHVLGSELVLDQLQMGSRWAPDMLLICSRPPNGKSLGNFISYLHLVTQLDLTYHNTQPYTFMFYNSNHPVGIYRYLQKDTTFSINPYAEASRDYVCKTSATTGRHVENFHITETTI